MDDEGMQNKLLASDFACRTRKWCRLRARELYLQITRCFSSAGLALKLDAGSHQF
jgi:hypothetical protein